VLVAGRSIVGNPGAFNQCRILSGPQLGCCRRPGGGADRCRDVGRNPMRAMVRHAALLAQPVRTVTLVALDPLVPVFRLTR